jgi:hypothetical protein
MTWFAVGSFEDDLRRFKINTERKLELVARKVALELFRRVILKTPVDKGRARANWQASLGSPATGTVDATDKTKSGGPTFRTVVAASAGFNVGDTIYLANNLPYIRRLEEGYSQQAPAGMVALTVQEFAQVVNQISAEVGRQ